MPSDVSQSRSSAQLDRFSNRCSNTRQSWTRTANPYAYDNLGILRDAPSQEIRDSIVQGRIRHLQHEINTFEDQIRKILGGGS